MKFLGLKTKEKDDGNPYGLNIDVSNFLLKLSMPVQFSEIVKVPSMHKRATSYLGVPSKQISVKPKDKPIMIQSVSSKSRNGYPPFFIALEVNGLILHNCMLDSGAEVNVMPLRVMEQLELNVTGAF